MNVCNFPASVKQDLSKERNNAPKEGNFRNLCNFPASVKQDLSNKACSFVVVISNERFFR